MSQQTWGHTEGEVMSKGALSSWRWGLDMLACGSILVPQTEGSLHFLHLGFYWGSFQRHDRLNYWPLVIDSNISPITLPGNQGWDWNQEFGSPGNHLSPPLRISKSHLININSAVVERGLLWIPRYSFPLYGSEAISGTEQETKYYNKKTPIAFITQEIPTVLGAMSQEPWTITKYIFL